MFNKDSFLLGVCFSLASMIVASALIYVVCMVIHYDFRSHPSLIFLAFVPPALLLRYYAKTKRFMHTTAGIITTLLAALITLLFLMKHFSLL